MEDVIEIRTQNSRIVRYVEGDDAVVRIDFYFRSGNPRTAEECFRKFKEGCKRVNEKYRKI